MKRFLILSMPFLALCITCCKPKPEPVPQHERPQWVLSHTSDVESGMTITGRLPEHLIQYADTTDLVAAFHGDECCGTASIQWVLGQPYYFLAVLHPTGESENVQITLRYYNANRQYIYVEKDAFLFVEDKIIGTIDAPFVADFTTYE